MEKGVGDSQYEMVGVRAPRNPDALDVRLSYTSEPLVDSLCFIL